MTLLRLVKKLGGGGTAVVLKTRLSSPSHNPFNSNLKLIILHTQGKIALLKENLKVLLHHWLMLVMCGFLYFLLRSSVPSWPNHKLS